MACGLEVSADSVPNFTSRGIASVKEQRRQCDRSFAAPSHPSQPAVRWSRSAFGCWDCGQQRRQEHASSRPLGTLGNHCLRVTDWLMRSSSLSIYLHIGIFRSHLFKSSLLIHASWEPLVVCEPWFHGWQGWLRDSRSEPFAAIGIKIPISSLQCETRCAIQLGRKN